MTYRFLRASFRALRAQAALVERCALRHFSFSEYSTRQAERRFHPNASQARCLSLRYQPVASCFMTFPTLSDQLFLSVSQIHAGLKRAEAGGLFSTERRKPVKRALEELIVHGVGHVVLRGWRQPGKAIRKNCCSAMQLSGPPGATAQSRNPSRFLLEMSTNDSASNQSRQSCLPNRRFRERWTVRYFSGPHRIRFTPGECRTIIRMHSSSEASNMPNNNFDQNAIIKIARYQKAVLLLILLSLLVGAAAGIIVSSHHLTELHHSSGYHEY